MNKFLTPSLLVMIYLSIAHCNPFALYEKYSLESTVQMYPNVELPQRLSEPTFNLDNHIGYYERQYVNPLNPYLLNDIILYLIDYANSLQKIEHRPEPYPYWVRKHEDMKFK